MLEFIRKRRNIRIGILIATGVAVLALSYYLSAIVNPLLIALLIAYILNPLVTRIERISIPLGGRRIGPGRTGAVVIIYLTGLSLIALCLIVVLPVVFSELKYLAFAVPGEPVIPRSEVFPEDGESASPANPLAVKKILLTEPYVDGNGNGRYDAGEKYTDCNGNGFFDEGEPFWDLNRNGRHDPDERFTDINENSVYDGPEPYEDKNGNGEWDPGDSYLDLNKDGIFNPSEPYRDLNKNGERDAKEPYEDGNGNGSWDKGESFIDLNGNGTWDGGEPFTDLNGNNRWDPNEGATFRDLNDNGHYDPPEPYEDKNINGNFDPGEPFVDRNSDGHWTPGEKYEDLNGNNSRDVEILYDANFSMTPEPFVDLNGNHFYDKGEDFTDLNDDKEYSLCQFYIDTNGNRRFDLGYALLALVKIREWRASWNKRFPSQKIDISLEEVQDEMSKSLKGSGEQFQSLSAWILYAAKSGLMGMLDIVSIFILIPFYTFFFLRSLNGIRDTIHDHLPGVYRDRIWRILTEINQSVSSFFRGRLVICFVVAAATWLVLVCFGVRFSLLLGIVMGLSVIVPFLSIFLVTIPVMIILLVDGGSMMQILGAVGALAVIQNIENFLLTPKVLGKETQLHPVTIFVSFLIGGSLFGLFGVLLAVPLASITKILGKHFILPQITALAKETPRPEPATETGLFERK